MLKQIAFKLEKGGNFVKTRFKNCTAKNNTSKQYKKMMLKASPKVFSNKNIDIEEVKWLNEMSKMHANNQVPINYCGY